MVIVMRLIDADELLKDLYDWKEEVENNPYISSYERIPKAGAIESAIDYVKEQRTVGIWFPVEVALPKEGKYVLISMTDGWITIAEIMWKPFLDSSSKEYYWLSEEGLMHKSDSVTAWMQLPQSYEEGKETEWL